MNKFPLDHNRKIKKPPKETYYMANSSKEWWFNQAWWDAWEVQEKERLAKSQKPGDHKFYFGKHKGKTVREVYNIDLRYFDWIISKFDDNNRTRKMIVAYIEEVNR